MPGADRYELSLARIDAEHAQDPERDAAGESKELVYARRMSAWLQRLEPAASESLRLAVRCQHLRRWEIRRGDYPAGAGGYLQWRSAESAAHARLAGEILAANGYEAAMVQRVQSLIRKEKLKQDPETQLLEDATCLAFLELQFAEFAAKHDEAKLLRILRKTWTKMSRKGREAALALELPGPLRAIVEQAVAKCDCS